MGSGIANYGEVLLSSERPGELGTFAIARKVPGSNLGPSVLGYSLLSTFDLYQKF
jgi:hypothetical protein